MNKITGFKRRKVKGKNTNQNFDSGSRSAVELTSN